jgi:DNA replication and repair protein RecF
LIERIILRNIRNYRYKEVRFEKGINVVTGRNGSGKTNLLEAVFFALEGRSPRTKDIKEMVRWGEEKGTVEAFMGGDTRARRARTVGEKGVDRNRHPGVRAVFFHPDDILIIKGGPEKRRRALDEAVAGLKPGYSASLSEYARVLSQKNRALKEVRKREKGGEILEYWDRLLVEKGREVLKEREKVLGEIAEEVGRISREWGKGEITYRYYKTLDCNDEEGAVAKLRRMREGEVRRGVALAGPHRDEVVMALGGRNLRRSCSQGEQKMAALFWRIGQAELMRRAGERVVLLLDDCLSELDEDNVVWLVNELEKWDQSVVTTAVYHRRLIGYKKVGLSETEVMPCEGDRGDPESGPRGGDEQGLGGSDGSSPGVGGNSGSGTGLVV